MTYLDWMRPRIRELYRVLKPTGSFYYHCDWHASHYVKVELDRIFGFNNFQNEIVWYRLYAHNDPKRFGASHDVLLFYAKSPKKTWHRLVWAIQPGSRRQLVPLLRTLLDAAISWGPCRLPSRVAISPMNGEENAHRRDATGHIPERIWNNSRRSA